MLPLLWLLAACSPTLRVPGPLDAVGHAPSLAAWDVPARPSPSPAPARPEHPRDFGRSLADAASFYLSHQPKSWRHDCSGFVCAAAARAGWALQGNTRSLWVLAERAHAVHHRKVPAVGDLAFFDNTYDRNRNGKVDDPLTHVAVVIGVQSDGTVLLAHAGTSEGRTTLRMNLEHPDERVDAHGKVLNDWLRRDRPEDPPGTPHLAGQCWRAFATLDPPAPNN